MKVSISKKVLDENVSVLNEFLSSKGLSQIYGGYVDESIKEPEWGNTNYSESIRPMRP